MALEAKVGFLLSAGGAAFARSVQLSNWAPNRFHVVCDRECGALIKASDLKISHEIVSHSSRSEMSAAASQAFDHAGCDVVVTHFSRLVGSELFDNILTVNVHPALLPAYPGLDGVGDAAKAGAPIQGATLHIVDAGMDTGQILAQTAHLSPHGVTLNWRHALAYRQKTAMTLVMLDWLDHDFVDTSSRGLRAFNLAAMPKGDMHCTPGFASRIAQQSAAGLYDDLVDAGIRHTS